MATWADIRADLAAAIEAVTPAVRPDIPYRELSYVGAPDEQSDVGPFTLRSFVIEPGPVGRPDGYQGPLPGVVRTATIHLFYPADAPVWDWHELTDIAGDDLDHIATTLRKYTRNRTAISVVLGDAKSIDLRRVKNVAGLWAQRLVLPILYRRGAVTLLDNYEAGDVPSFVDTDAMEAATLAGEQLGNIDGSLYQLVDGTATLLLTSGVDGYQAGDVPAYADETAIEGATLYGEQVAYSTADSRLAHLVSGTSRLLYDLGDVPSYANTAAMEAATLYGEQVASIGSQLYQLVDGTATELNVPTVKTVERDAANLPQTTQTAYFTVTGRVVLLQAVGEVTTVIQAQTNNIKLVSNPTVGVDVDLCTALDIDADAAGTLYTMTGTKTDAMVATTSGAAPAQSGALIVADGTIDLSASASSTGATKWTIHYAALDAGSTVVAA